MATNKQRRDAERLRLQRQLEARRQREVARKRTTLIASIVGTLVVIAAVVVGIVAATGGDDDKSTASKPGGASATPSGSSGAPTSPASSTAAATPCTTAGLPGVVTFDGVSVGNSTNLAKEPKVCSSSTKTPTALTVKDLVVGKGKAATPTSNVTVQYTGVLYQKGTQFDSSWARGQAADFPLTGVVPGFTQGIGGNGKVAPMKIGGRRIIIMPSALGYGANGQPPTIPANAPLVFVVDLTKIA